MLEYRNSFHLFVRWTSSHAYFSKYSLKLFVKKIFIFKYSLIQVEFCHVYKYDKNSRVKIEKKHSNRIKTI